METRSLALPYAYQLFHKDDTLTEHQGCWRAYLWQKLQQANIKNTDFVGTLGTQNCGFAHDGENEGHVSTDGTSLDSV